jgi:hypothetical protein
MLTIVASYTGGSADKLDRVCIRIYILGRVRLFKGSSC